ncbi:MULTISPECIES: HAD-IA family hydrolase [unclassified Variovorax]|uniref:HAD-IA family hydrolase n=1 Tax=unclassified Variovorax TaxID=663243 RepID=UPI000A4C61B0|nr:MULTISPECIES: HAD-IA family hydrolase [unclassified Variovorax]PNG51780.1 (S)-2-haloacid dehalogenase [Variovorax sp. B2]PNG54127.1 (S)-2-haloacid dehalogenase [Variovorax sp. B4]VTV11603.1 (S)-2-haloacid dehalogenase [Variovorax sp. WDL1]
MNRWITFDCYGTLIDWRTGMTHALEIVCPGQGAALLASHLRIEKGVESELPFRPYSEVLAETMRRMAKEAGLTLRAGDEHVLSQTLPFWPIYPDTNAALKQLRAQGWKLAILSNVDRSLIARTLTKFDIDFDLVVTAEDVKAYKPSTALSERFLDITGTRPDDWLYAAVGLHYDLTPTRHMGSTGVWVNRDAELDPDTQFLFANIPAMAQLPEVAERFLQKRVEHGAQEK